MSTQHQFCRSSFSKQESRQVPWHDSTLSHAKRLGATHEGVAPIEDQNQYRRFLSEYDFGKLVKSMCVLVSLKIAKFVSFFGVS
jgi:hypothetical protein